MAFNPFPGLRSFDVEEHHLFFGREQHVADLLRKLYNHHFVAVVGTSGSGKSSLIRAGLLPSIQKGLLAEGQEHWYVATMKPGTTPMQNLVTAVLASNVLGDGTEASHDQLLNYVKKSSLGLVQGVRSSLQGDRKLLILVDQFEELFRYRDESNKAFTEEANAFVRLIIDSITQKDVPIYVVLTLRSDFLGDCVSFEGLPEAINDGHYLVPRLNREQNRQAITKPVDLAKGKISPRLVQALLNDLNDDPDQLPVMQHALMRTWDHWVNNAEPGDPMEVVHYEAVGGMESALSVHADEAYFELPTERLKQVAKLVFQCITVKTTGNRGIRRPTSLRHVCAVTGATSEEVTAAIEPFRDPRRSFVLPGLDKQLDADSVLDISHESLMRGWHRLVTWVDEETASAEIYSRLSENAMLYQSGKSGLYRDPELQIAIDWKEKHQPGKAWADQYNSLYDYAMTYLDLSYRENMAEIRRKRKNALILRSIGAVFLVTITCLTIWALFQTDIARKNSERADLKAAEALDQKQQAEAERERAQISSQEALDAKGLAERQSEIALKQKMLAEQLKVQAEEQARLATKYGNEAVEQKQRAEQQRLEALRQKQLAENSEKEAVRLSMISIGQNLAFKSNQVVDDPQLAALLAYHSYGMINANQGVVFDPQLYNALNRANQLTDPSFKPYLFKRDQEVKSLCNTNGGMQLILKNGAVDRMDIEGRSIYGPVIINELSGGINTAHFPGDASLLVAGLDDNRILVFRNSGTPTFLHELKGHAQLLRTCDISPDGKRLATGARDSMVIIWEGAEAVKRWKLRSRIRQVRFDATGKALFVGTENGMLLHIEIETGSQKTISSIPGNRIQDIGSTSDRGIFAASYSDGTVLLFDSKGNVQKTIKERTRVDYVLLDGVGQKLILVSGLKKIRIFQLDHLSNKPIEVLSNVNISGISLGDGGELLFNCSDNSVRRISSDPALLHEKLKKRLTREMTTSEWESYIGAEVPYNQYTRSSKI